MATTVGYELMFIPTTWLLNSNLTIVSLLKPVLGKTIKSEGGRLDRFSTIYSIGLNSHSSLIFSMPWNIWWCWECWAHTVSCCELILSCVSNLVACSIFQCVVWSPWTQVGISAFSMFLINFSKYYVWQANYVKAKVHRLYLPLPDPIILAL